VSEQRAEKSRGPCMIDGVDAAGAIGSGFTNAAAMGSGNLTGMLGLGLTGVQGAVGVLIAMVHA
jgi:hypothetical protein